MKCIVNMHELSFAVTTFCLGYMMTICEDIHCFDTIAHKDYFGVKLQMLKRGSQMEACI